MAVVANDFQTNTVLSVNQSRDPQIYQPYKQCISSSACKFTLKPGSYLHLKWFFFLNFPEVPSNYVCRSKQKVLGSDLQFCWIFNQQYAMNHRGPLVLSRSYYVSLDIHQKVDTPPLQYVSFVKKCLTFIRRYRNWVWMQHGNMAVFWIFSWC